MPRVMGRCYHDAPRTLSTTVFSYTRFFGAVWYCLILAPPRDRDITHTRTHSSMAVASTPCTRTATTSFRFVLTICRDNPSQFDPFGRLHTSPASLVLRRHHHHHHPKPAIERAQHLVLRQPRRTLDPSEYLREVQLVRPSHPLHPSHPWPTIIITFFPRLPHTTPGRVSRFRQLAHFLHVRSVPLPSHIASTIASRLAHRISPNVLRTHHTHPPPSPHRRPHPTTPRTMHLLTYPYDGTYVLPAATGRTPPQHEPCRPGRVPLGDHVRRVRPRCRPDAHPRHTHHPRHCARVIFPT